MSLLDIKFTEPKLKDFKCFRLPIDNLPKYKEALIFGNVYNFFGTFIDDDFEFTQTPFSGEGSADNFMNFGQFVLNGGHATIIASKETCNYYRRLYKEFYKAGFGTTHPKVNFFEIDDIKFLTGKFKVKEGKEEKIVKGEYFWSQNKKEEWEFNYLDLLKTIFENGEKKEMAVIANPPFGIHNHIAKSILKFLIPLVEESSVLVPKNTFKDKEIWQHTTDLDLLKENPFEDASVQNPTVSIISKRINNTDSFETINLDKNRKIFFNAVKKCNKELGELYYLPYAGCKQDRKISDFCKTVTKETFKEAYKNGKLFFFTQWTPSNGVHLMNESEDIQANIYNNMNWDKKGLPMHAFYFETKIEKDNFQKWWYSCLENQNGKKQKIGLTNYILSIMCKSQSANGGNYNKFFPGISFKETQTDESIVSFMKEKDYLDKSWTLGD